MKTTGVDFRDRFLNHCGSLYDHLTLGLPVPQDFSLEEYDVVMMIHAQIIKLQREREEEMERKNRMRRRRF